MFLKKAKKETRRIENLKRKGRNKKINKLSINEKQFLLYKYIKKKSYAGVIQMFKGGGPFSTFQGGKGD